MMVETVLLELLMAEMNDKNDIKSAHIGVSWYKMYGLDVITSPATKRG